ncbi:MAG: hypothetical protein KGZ33_05540 [Alkaliphilus sp.]|nr:hypothetical protein [Alkaliphilus sp.]
MIAAQKKYSYSEVEKLSPQVMDTPGVILKKKNAIKPAQKVQIIFCVLIMCSICIGILLGYAQLAEEKFIINSLRRDIKELEGSIENLRVEVESAQRLDLIEQKAETVLGMQYPQKEQLVFLSINDHKIAASNELEQTDMAKQNNIIVDVKGTIQRLINN